MTTQKKSVIKNNVLIIENGYVDLVKSRFPLGEFLEQRGCCVKYACPQPPKETRVFSLNVSRSNPLFQLFSSGVRKLVKIEKKQKIDVVLSFRHTSNILNYFASFFGKNRSRIAVITGLGYCLFITTRYKILKYLMSVFYKMAEKD